VNCKDYRFKDFILDFPEKSNKQLQNLEDMLGVDVTFTGRDLQELFVKDFKESCPSLVPIAQSVMLYDKNISNSLKDNNVNVSFQVVDKVYRLTMPAFNGKLTDDFRFDNGALTGEASVYFWGQATIRTGRLNTQSEYVAFYVRVF
jgi:hypothetical protein